MGAYRKEFWNDADVRCPFYISEDRQAKSVSCEGYSDGADLISRFRTLAQRERHMGVYCVSGFAQCPVYRCIYEAKYADGVI